VVVGKNLGKAMLLFEDLLNEENFTDAANKLACDFREKHNLPPIHQLGLVVSDVETAAAQLEKMGIGPFLIMSGDLKKWVERGESIRFHTKVGLATHHGIDIELLEPGEGSDFYGQHLDPDGRTVIHHLGFFVKDTDKEVANMNAKGCLTWVRGIIQAGPASFNVGYMDTLSELGMLIEIIQFKAFGIRFRPPGFSYHLLGWLEKTCGIRCINAHKEQY
jgi:hypothetical protein